jgi:signal transduction histidine kinase
MSLINVQAGVALHLMDDDPEQARTALAAIKQSSGQLLREMRATLGVLRGVDEDPPRGPVAGLARLDDLLAENRAAGLPVVLEVTGERRALPPSVDHAAYRIVQEALTNTRRHAGSATATVRVRYDEDGVSVEVEDDGAGPPGTGATTDLPRGGNGIPGMRERALALGGSLSVGPRTGGGFQVHARLPATMSEQPLVPPAGERRPAGPSPAR